MTRIIFQIKGFLFFLCLISIGCQQKKPVNTQNTQKDSNYPPKAITKVKQYGIVNDSISIAGGYGSSMSVHPHLKNHFYLLTDRGPNFESDSISKAFPIPDFSPRIGLFRLTNDTLILVKDILLKDSLGQPLSGFPHKTGKSKTGEIPVDINGNILPADNKGLDSEGLVAMPDGTFWVSEEYAPGLLLFDSTGILMQRLSPHSNGKLKLPRVFETRQPNRGMEGLTITPDGNFLVGIMQTALQNPSKQEMLPKCRTTRLFTLNLKNGDIREYLYVQEDTFLSNSEIQAITDSTFLVIERDSQFPAGKGKTSANSSDFKRIYKININKATDVHDSLNRETGKLYNEKTIEQLTNSELSNHQIIPVEKTLVLDILKLPDYYHNKVEGIDYLKQDSMLLIVNDDDFGIDAMDDGSIKPKRLLNNQIDRSAIYFVKLTPEQYDIIWNKAKK